MELLAPAGNRENFMAALEAGADAIYLGGKAFNARAKACNFDMEELTELVRYAHLLGVAVYVTVNILVADRELSDLEAYICQLDTIGVDAVIVQDLATAAIVRKVAKRLEIHGSTQMTATNLATVNYLYEQGFSRVVLSRELSLDEIKYICKHAKAEIEVFIHGALCICYSGQCLMSSFIGGRSGNRGACAQPCRLPYELINSEGKSLLPKEEAYIMSPKDLNYAEYMEELIAAGVASFKVEGRMKKVSYVREVISTYRKIIDQKGKATQSDVKSLENGFNRGFAQNYLRNHTGRTMMTILAPNNQGKEIGRATKVKQTTKMHVSQELQLGDLLKIISNKGEVRYFTVDETWNAQDHFTYMIVSDDGPAEGIIYLVASSNVENARMELAYFKRKIPIYAYLDGVEGEPVSLTVMTEKGESVTVTNEYCLTRASKRATTMEQVSQQLGRLGNTLFALESVSMPEGAYMWPASVLNTLRRDGVTALEQILLEKYEEQRHWHLLPTEIIHRTLSCNTKKRTIKNKECNLSKGSISVRVDEIESVKAAIKGGADSILFGGDRLWRKPYTKDVYKEVRHLCKEYSVECVFVTPRIIKASEEHAYEMFLKELVSLDPDGISIHFLGALYWLKKWDYYGRIYADTSLNVFNATSIDYLVQQGVSKITLSEEVTLEQIREMRDKLKNTIKDKHILLEGIVQGNTELMVSEYCVIGAFIGTGFKKNCPMPCMKDTYFLKDRKGELFPLKTDPYCRMHIMNSRELDMQPYVSDLLRKGVHILRIEARQKDSAYILDMIQQYKALVAGMKEPVSKNKEGITRGHYFKGIF